MMMRCLCSKYGAKRFGGLVRTEINSEAAGPLNELSDDTAITRTQFEDLLAKIDKGLRALPATAQVRHRPQPCFVTSRFIIRIMLTNIVIVSV
jgi:NADH:ubiquinone reductase (non-electrogenic)